MVRASIFRSFNPLKLHGEFSYLLLKIDNGLLSSFHWLAKVTCLMVKVLLHWPSFKVVKSRTRVKGLRKDGTGHW